LLFIGSTSVALVAKSRPGARQRSVAALICICAYGTIKPEACAPSPPAAPPISCKTSNHALSSGCLIAHTAE
jgi:hypothetical protein